MACAWAGLGPGPFGQDGVGQRARRTNHDLRLLFNFMDKDGDGQVNRNELRKALRRDPHVRQYLGLPLKLQHGSEEQAAYEVRIQTYCS